MKKFNTILEIWEKVAVDTNLNEMRQKLDDQNIPYSETWEGLFIEDDEEANIA